METILITGSTGILGKEFVTHFLNKGMNVIAVYRNQEKSELTYKNFSPKGSNLYGICIDLSEKDSSKKILEEIEKIELFPEYLVNVAAGCDSFNVDKDGFSKREDMIENYTLNVVVPYELSFNLANHKQTKLKKIVNISSMYGIVPYNPCLYNNPLTETPIQYSITKSALIHLTKELAIRFADKEITVNCISYGGVEGRASEEFKQKLAKLTPLKRMMTPKETVKALDFLVSENSTYMTGHNLVVDGGRTIW